jgi:cation diffusion facilitator CzcD-associated flavoprotein CzcO
MTARTTPGSGAAAEEFPIAIIGAGFAGIGMAIRLQQAGIESFTIFERAAQVGGTWRDNTYPGAACDVPSHVYSLSFEPHPGWTQKFSPAAEIQAYLVGLVEKWGLRAHLRLGVEVVAARFDEDAGRWSLSTQDAGTFEARVVVSGVGGLIDPKLPEIAGLETFAGEIFHTARWNHDYDLGDKRVGVIGTGASAVQVVPSLAPVVRRLSVFQRTAAWVVPKRDRRYGARRRRFYARFPSALRASRVVQYLMSELFGPMVFLDSRPLSAVGEALSRAHLRAQVTDPSLREKLTPAFQFGCKRILISDEYWATFERENVELVTEPIAEVRPEGIVTRDGRVQDLDAIVLATGFALGLARAPFPVTGRAGRSLDETWRRGAVAYKGMAVSGFPNWFILMGPNTGPGHTSVLVYTEAQIEHALQAIQRLRREGLRYVDVRQDVQDRYNARLQGRMKYMVWSGCKSWYLSEDGENHALYPGFAAEYALRARRFDAADYELAAFAQDRPAVPRSAAAR